MKVLTLIGTRPEAIKLAPVVRAPNVTLTAPLDYDAPVHVLKRCHLVVTDFGGLQEEAPGLRMPVLMPRSVTERPEAVAAGTVRLVGTRRDDVSVWTRRLLCEAEYERMANAVIPYGDGRAAGRISEALVEAAP
jgi:UDP-N-acetylglucosamine 2-epimerase (non-hydrolysing)